MVKAYLRYEPRLVFGVIVSVDSNISYDPSGKLLLAGALDSIAAWDIKKGLRSSSLSPSSNSSHSPSSSHSLAVTSIASSPSSSSSSVASGHADGSIRLWDLSRSACETTLNGHSSATTVLRYNHLGSLLASGSKDCDIILWDVVAEAGLFRLRGHRDQVTDLVFLDSVKKLVSCSKDKFVRVWDLEMQHCIQTVSGHHSEIWSLDVDPNERFLVTGSSDPELRFYHIRNEAEDADNSTKWEVLKYYGEIKRQGKDRVATVRFNKSGSLLACQEAGRTVEIYRLLEESKAKSKAKRRVRRKKEKVLAKAGEGNENRVLDAGQNASDGTISVPVILVSDVFKLLQVLRTSKKICSIAFCPAVLSKGTVATLSLSLNNNVLETYSIEEGKAEKKYTVELQGHRSDIRSVSLSSDNTIMLSTSHNAVKVWNPSTGACIRTIECGYGLCCCFAPGDSYALVGTKTGTLELIDVGSGTRTEVIEAHTAAIRSIIPIQDENDSAGAGFITGSADYDVKFWEYQLRKTETGSKQLTVANVKTLKMNDDVLVVTISPDAKYIAVALLDCTVRVFFLDSLKFFLSLYGHKLPVLCMDISSDGDLIVTGSADKNLKIWGLDFGDCHKSIFAHADSVMDVKFVRNTHYMFSVGKDRLVKYWDADKFELLLTLVGHHAEVWCLTISFHGDFVITGSHDRSLRRWDRTEEPFFLEEEREKRLEEMFESDLDINENKYAPREELPEEGSVGVPGKKTKETFASVDLVIDALDTAEAELKRYDQYNADKQNRKVGEFQPNVLMRGLSPSDYVLHAICDVQSNALEQALLCLPYTDALKLMSYLKDWIQNSDKVELVCRITTVLLQTHHNQLITTPAAKPMLTVLKDILHSSVKECKDIIGFNLAAMDHLKELMSIRSDAPFRDAKAKLMQIRQQLSDRSDGTRAKRRKKKQ
ncbi:Dynein assembly factor with WDR repeat domains 1 [Apostasia shenzhenica]|uniref:Dynein assembly factor with WDR repeat domains 1 n=1 Tax=Apostasia shenzhenica TaxID=1088818 RepID=A0A2I0AB72_9ASPA|nr:Dynein assembly factor with WDR repeat domains 1 [Apostasia shenzhenica]